MYCRKSKEFLLYKICLVPMNYHYSGFIKYDISILLQLHMKEKRLIKKFKVFLVQIIFDFSIL